MFTSKSCEVDKGTEAGMRKVRKGPQNGNHRFYMGIRWMASGDRCRVQARQFSGTGWWHQSFSGTWESEHHALLGLCRRLT